MIRIVTRSRLAVLQQDVDRAVLRLRETRRAADRAYAGHLRTVWNLTDELEAARGTVADLESEIKSLNQDLDVMAGSAVLLNYGKLHSVHRDEQSAKRHAASFGADPNGWGPAGDRPVAESVWRISPLSRWAVADGGDAG